MLQRLRRVHVALILLLVMLGIWGGHGLAPSAQAETAAQEAGPAVYIVPVKQTVEQGLKSFLERAYKEAEEARAERIILVINTLGGRVDSAEEIGHLIRTSPIPTTAFVEGKAVSAGTYIALNAEHIVMQPGSTIGAAAVVDGSGTLITSPKVISFWTKQMTEAAELQGRNPNLAAAMVNPSVVLDEKRDGIAKAKGDILTLSANEAAKLGYAEHTASSVEETLTWLKLDQRDQIAFHPSFAENAARWLVNPAVMTVLLILGIAGVAIEMLVPGLGFPGFVGIVSFGLYFFGHYIAGFAGMESLVLFILGLALLVIELFVPSFGILGILGSLALIAGVITAAPDPKSALLSLGVAFVLAVVIIYFAGRKYKGRGIWNRFILKESLTTEEGFIPAESKEALLGSYGVSITPLRPAGTALIDGHRIDVVTDGVFIDTNEEIVVIKVEGTRVVVQLKV
ncbi:nodulation protein NfeD [Paenibacillus sp. GCM10023252]|uniref:NfeD family protein n=1 Tax=Paenibacillus sp. GCM10023252 TaxID=3252649 RepID=UPI00361889E4